MLLTEMLIKKPENRIDLKDATEHCWFDSVRTKFEASTPANKKPF
jgi:hypothetical protein